MPLIKCTLLKEYNLVMVEAKMFLFNLCYQVSIGLAVLCLPVLRYYHPEWERPIKVNYIFPVVYILATIFITIVPMIASPIETG